MQRNCLAPRPPLKLFFAPRYTFRGAPTGTGMGGVGSPLPRRSVSAGAASCRGCEHVTCTKENPGCLLDCQDVLCLNCCQQLHPDAPSTPAPGGGATWQGRGGGVSSFGVRRCDVGHRRRFGR